jgi:uncharacterized protein YjbI with pentapeptide repeats
MKIEIKNRVNESVIYFGEFDTIKDCVISAVKSRADLSWANLSWANLSGANLYGANLSWANLSGANLSGPKISILGPLMI